MTAPFVTGDIVRLENGRSAIKVLEVDFIRNPSSTTWYGSLKFHKSERGVPPELFRPGWFIRFSYMSSLSYEHEGRAWRRAEDFVLYNESETPMSAVLYQTKEETPRFGTFLTKAKGGKIVLEMKGKEGDVQAFDPSEIEEVVPYTVAIAKLHGGEGNAQIRHYELPEGSVANGDVLLHLSTGALFEVVELDSGKKHPTQSKNGFLKLEGQRLKPAVSDK